MSDPLSALVGLLRPHALIWKHMAGLGTWAWRMPANEGVVFGRVLDGACRYDVPGFGSGLLATGDAFLLAAPPSWELRSVDGAGQPIDFDALPADARSIGTRDGLADGGVRISGGHFVFDAANTQLLLPYLSRITHIRTAENESRGQLDALLELFDAEASAERPGHEAVLSRLLEVLLVELLRAPGESAAHHLGMMVGLSDPQIGRALRAFHTDIQRTWSVASLAGIATMSRTTFAGRFTDLVGISPMHYVSQWRMAVARDALREGRRSIDEIAAAIGYGSRSAFSTAFTRSVGVPPARFASSARLTRVA